jgi:peptide/nickel transport system substrate-binding protein
MRLDRNPAYVPRKEPADFLSGGKLARVDSVRLRVIPDQSTAVNALQTGEIDFLEYAPFDLLPQLARNPDVKLMSFKGEQMAMGFVILNHKTKPFDDPAVRQVMLRLVSQPEMLQALGVPAEYSQVCRSYFLCNTPYEAQAGAEAAANPSVEAARAALKATSYNGEKVVIMQAMDVAAGRVSGDVVADLMRRAGFNVDLQATDWGTIVGRRTRQEGWSVYGSSSSGFDLASPLTNFYTANNCGNYPGWNCQPEMTPLLRSFAAAATTEERRAIANKIQALAYQDAGWILWGQFAQPNAYRANLHGLIQSAIPVFWNVEKTQ